MSTTSIRTSDLAVGARPEGAVDPRGPQFTAALTAVVLAAVLLTSPPVAVALLAVQTVLFALGAIRGVQATPIAWLFRTVVRPRLAPTDEWEAPEPPRFAQAVGLGFALVGLTGFVLGATVLAQVAVGAALTAALLNALFRFCLGCEVYLLARQFAFH
ncbi:MAG: DUF4395 domain-containing protein [Nocardioides sp.]|nr:DUF4395 domain-containing protein [Nocardioides sp.]